MTSATLELHGLIGQSSNALASTPYVRPADWLSLPAVLTTDQKFVGLIAVQPDSNFVAISAEGDYTIDWGDGSILEDRPSGSVSEHQYDYTNALLSGTLTSRGYKQAIITITPQSGQQLTMVSLNHIHSDLNQINSTTVNWLDISVSSQFLRTLIFFGGIESDPVNITAPLLEVINIFNSNLITCDYLFGDCASLAAVPVFNILPVVSRSIPVTSTSNGLGIVDSANHQLSVGDQLLVDNEILSGIPSSGITEYVSVVVTSILTDSFVISASHTATTPHQIFNYSGNVIYGRSFADMFGSNAKQLRALPFINTSGGINFFHMYHTQSQYVSQLPTINTSDGILFDYFAYGIQKMQSAPPLNLSKAKSVESMFANCTSLVNIPLFNTTNVQNFTDMLSSTGIRTLPLIDTSSGINFSSMFLGCRNLESVPLLDLSSGIQLSAMFGECYSLRNIPLFDTSQATNMSLMFEGCPSLITIPLLNTSSVAFFSGMFQSCSVLVSVPSLNMVSAISVTDIFAGCGLLTSAPLVNLSTSISIPLSLLSAAALNTIYNNLPTVTGSQQLIVSSNYGFAASTQSIATNKGWTLS